jgi:hypothetical protein
VVILVQDEVKAGPLEVRMKKKMRVGNNNGVRGRRMRTNVFYVNVFVCPITRIARKRGVELARIIQRQPPLSLINI